MGGGSEVLVVKHTNKFEEHDDLKSVGRTKQAYKHS